MNCEEFREHLGRFAAGTLEPLQAEAIAEHARACGDCGKQRRTYQELIGTIDGALQATQPPENLAREVTDEVLSETTVGLPLQSDVNLATAATGSVSLMVLLFATLVGGMLGYLLGQSQTNLAEQLMYTETLRRSGGGFGAALISGVMPAVSDAVKVIVLIFILLLLSRPQTWRGILPGKPPANLRIARWLSVVAVIAGGGYLVCGMLVTLAFVTTMASTGVRMRVFQESNVVLMGTYHMAGYLWWIAFWLALSALGSTVINRYIALSSRRA